MDNKPTNTALKIVVLLVLIALLIVGILLPIKLVPNAVTSLKNVFTSWFTSEEKTPVSPSTPSTPISPNTPSAATSTPTTPTKATSTPTITRSGNISNPQGTADLSVKIIAVGYLTDDGVFVRSGSISHKRAAVQFAVTNNGTKNTGSWSFKANLPTATNPVYVALNQPNLGPQDGILYTLGFDPINSNINNGITITVDHTNAIREMSESNNTAYITIVNDNSIYGGPTTKADLVVNTIRTSVDRDNDVTVQFEVQNIGKSASGSWKFTADLPTSGSATFYTSPSQNSLAAGAKIILTLTFTAEEDYGNKIIIDVDSEDSVDESNEYNNTKTTTINLY